MRHLAAHLNAATITTVLLTALTAGLTTGLAAFWAYVTYDPAGLLYTAKITLVLTAIGVDLAWMTRTTRRLAYAYRRPS